MSARYITGYFDIHIVKCIVLKNCNISFPKNKIILLRYIYSYNL